LHSEKINKRVTALPWHHNDPKSITPNNTHSLLPLLSVTILFTQLTPDTCHDFRFCVQNLSLFTQHDKQTNTQHYIMRCSHSIWDVPDCPVNAVWLQNFPFQFHWQYPHQLYNFTQIPTHVIHKRKVFFVPLHYC
jgi:hypothetical protein